MFSFGAKSEQRLVGVHPHLVRVTRRALELTSIDFAVTEGLRTHARQMVLVTAGASRTMASRHLTGHAVDIAPAIAGDLRWDWPLFYHLADAMFRAAKMEAVPLRWGGAWDWEMGPGVELVASAETLSSAYVDACRRRGKNPFLDGPHFELSARFYPAEGEMFGMALSPKLVRREYPMQDGSPGLILHEHWCPGCNCLHQIAVDTPFRNGAQWTFDGNAAAPPFSPSISIRMSLNIKAGRPERRCHYFIRAGRIEFCADSTHALAGQFVDLPDIPTEELR